MNRGHKNIPIAVGENNLSHLDDSDDVDRLFTFFHTEAKAMFSSLWTFIGVSDEEHVYIYTTVLMNPRS